MRKLLIILFLIGAMPVLAKTMTGEVAKEETETNRIYDVESNLPIEGVIIKIPAKHYKTKTDKNGTFSLKTNITAPTIMALEKNGYKPYSMTLGATQEGTLNLGIEKTTPKDITLETDMIHIGDDSYSENSANAGEFSIKSAGAYYTKDFNVKHMNDNEELFVIIGSIIGIDTIEAQKMGQSHVKTAYSSSPELFFNGNKIAEIKINGDNQKIKIPQGLIKVNQKNNITIKTGRNLYKLSAIDYDDIEFTNLLLEIK